MWRCVAARRRQWLKRRHRKSTVCSKKRFVGLACIRHQHRRCVPIPFFAEPAEKFHARAGKKRKKKSEKKKPERGFAKIGQLES
jgi:hypothetical protein